MKIRGKEGEWITAIFDAFGYQPWEYRDVKPLIRNLFDEELHQQVFRKWIDEDWIELVRQRGNRSLSKRTNVPRKPHDFITYDHVRLIKDLVERGDSLYDITRRVDPNQMRCKAVQNTIDWLRAREEWKKLPFLTPQAVYRIKQNVGRRIEQQRYRQSMGWV